MSTWKSIRSAPKDGTRVLATWAGTWPSTPHIEVCQYSKAGYWFFSCDGDRPDKEDPPTHWMPLPDPPPVSPERRQQP